MMGVVYGDRVRRAVRRERLQRAFTFAGGTGVPAGESAVVTALPTPPPCVAPGPHVRAESSLLGRDLHDDDPAAVATVPGV
jgi:hypothetical protein